MKYKCLDFLLVSFYYYIQNIWLINFLDHLDLLSLNWFSIKNLKFIGNDIYIPDGLIQIRCNISHLSSTILFCCFISWTLQIKVRFVNIIWIIFSIKVYQIIFSDIGIHNPLKIIRIYLNRSLEYKNNFILIYIVWPN